MKLSDQVVLVTGSSRGLGAAIARAFAAEGARVVINFQQNRELAEALAADIKPGGLAIQADVTDPAQVEAMFRQAEEHFGQPVHTVVNNALPAFEFNGDARPKLGDITWAAFDQQLQGIVRGALNTTQAALPGFSRLPKGSGGRIINIGSNLVANPVVPYQDYTAAKGALLAFTRTCAAELGPRGITCNMVSGGLLRTTDASRATPDAVFEQVAHAAPLRSVATPEQVAGAVLFFASPWASAATGQNLNVDCGLVMT
ncbi:Pyridoxal 4-dehydrogenase [Apiospora rasikravindrae]|uniref:Pyridoxal 4-dehydrogenase n=1 Tax=Apiospora rasikravindrae TaxID=990691 RepID=A0ABR1S0J6_9PEZI